MTSALRDYSTVLRAALALQRPHMHVILLGAALLGALAAGGLAWIKTLDPAEVALNAVRAVYAMLACGWLMMFIQGAIGLNTPAHAKLVPRVRRRAMQMTALAWLAATSGSAVLALGSPVAPILVFLGAGLALIAAGLGRSGHRAGGSLFLMIPIGIFVNGALPHAWRPLLGSMPALALALLLMLALGAFTLGAMFPHGGERHFRLRATQQLASDRAAVEAWTRQASVPRIGLWTYAAALRRACARREAGPLLMHIVGPGVHWTARLLSMAFFVIIAAGVMAVLTRVADPGTLTGIASSVWLALSTVMLLPLFDVERRLKRLSVTRAEQGLVRLVPGVPGAAIPFNRLLASRLLLAALVDWAIATIGVLCVVALTGASSSILWMQACLCCLTLPLLAATLRDHAYHGGTAGLPLVLWQVASLGACLMLGALAGRLFDVPLLPVVALASVLLAVAAVVWRWPDAVAAPHAFPVGRLA